MAANEEELGALHTKLATTLNKLLDGQYIEGETYEENGETIVAEATVIPPSAAIMAVAAKFLKDNNITATPAPGSALAELKQRMEDRAKARAQRATRSDLSLAGEDMKFTAGLPN